MGSNTNNEEVEDILSNSQISRAHKFNIKRFSAALIHEPVVENNGKKEKKLSTFKSKSPPKTSKKP